MRSALIGFSTACALAFAAVYLVAFGTDRGLRFDLATFTNQGTRGLPNVQRATAGLVDVVDVGMLVLVGGGIVLATWRRGRGDIALSVAILLAGAIATSQVLKPLLGAADPYGRDALRVYHSSFPSGHATIAMALALAVVVAAPAAWRLPAALAGGAYAAAMGASLLIQRWHYASDVAGGFLIAGVWAGIVTAWRPVPPPRSWPESPRTAAVAAGGLLAIFALAILLVLRTHAGVVHQHVEDYTRFTAAVAGFVALAFAVCVGFALVLQASTDRSSSTTRS